MSSTKDYLVHINDHAEEITCTTFNEARKQAASYKRMGFDDVTIDQYEDEELTGVYWVYYKGKLIKKS